MLNGHDHLYARYRPLDPSGNYDPKKGIREFIVGTGGETLDPVVTTNTSRPPIQRHELQRSNLEAASGQFWGVMAPDAQSERLHVGFRVGTEGSGTADRRGHLQRQGYRHLPRSGQQIAIVSSSSRKADFASVRIPPDRCATDPSPNPLIAFFRVIRVTWPATISAIRNATIAEPSMLG